MPFLFYLWHFKPKQHFLKYFCFRWKWSSSGMAPQIRVSLSNWWQTGRSHRLPSNLRENGWHWLQNRFGLLLDPCGSLLLGSQTHQCQHLQSQGSHGTGWRLGAQESPQILRRTLQNGHPWHERSRHFVLGDCPNLWILRIDVIWTVGVLHCHLQRFLYVFLVIWREAGESWVE